MSRTRAVHVRFKRSCISQPSSTKEQRESSSAYFGEREPTTAILFLYFYLELIAGIMCLVWAGFQTDWRTEQIEIVTKFEGKI